MSSDQSGGTMPRSRRLALVAIGFLAAAASPARAEPLKIRAGWAVVPAQLTAILFERKDILKHYGTSYSFEAIRFRGSAPPIPALAPREIDIGAFAFSTFRLAIHNARMDDLRLIAALYHDRIPRYYTSQYVVRSDSAIT